MLAWEFPIKHSIVCVYLLTIEKRENIHTIEVLGQIGSSFSQSGKCWHHVWEIDHVFEFLYRDFTGLVNDEGDAYSAFIEHSFPSFETGIAIQHFERGLNSSSII